MTYPKNKLVLVLGDTGFLGKAVINELKRREIDFLGVSRKIGIDLRNTEQVMNLINQNQFSSIINCAAHVGGINYGLKNQRVIFEDNLRMNLTLLKIWMDTGSRVINPISNCAYPGHVNRFSEELFWDGPVHDSVYAYGNTRRTLVASSKIYADSLGLEVCNLIFPNLYGPGEKRDPEQAHALGGLIGRMVLAKKNNDEKFVVWGSGLPIREWLFVEDAADLMVEASQSDQVFHLRNFGIGKGISIAELTELIAVYLEYNGDIVFDYSKPDGALEKIMVINDDSPKLSNKKYTELKVGIQKTIAWHSNS